MTDLIRSILGSLQMEYSELQESCPEVIEDVNQTVREYMAKFTIKYSEWRRGKMTPEAQKIIDQIVLTGQSPEPIIFYYWLNNIYEVH